MIDIITIRGTGEQQGASTNMLTYVTGALDPTKFQVIADLDYPASVGPVNGNGDSNGPSEESSVATAIANLAGQIRASSNLVGIMGYSLGAEVVSKFLEAQGAGQYADCELAFAACVANPLRAPGDSIDPGSTGYGINGIHAAWPNIPTFEAANPADAITSCPAGSPLRTLADDISAFSFADLGGWTADLAAKLRGNRFQPTSVDWWRNPVGTWQAYTAAAKSMLGFLDHQDHVMTYIQQGYCTRLAAAINTAF